jgi:hypothetical protein
MEEGTDIFLVGANSKEKDAIESYIIAHEAMSLLLKSLQKIAKKKKSKK